MNSMDSCSEKMTAPVDSSTATPTPSPAPISRVGRPADGSPDGGRRDRRDDPLHIPHALRRPLRLQRSGSIRTEEIRGAFISRSFQISMNWLFAVMR